MKNYTYICKDEDMHLLDEWSKGRKFACWDCETGPAPQYIDEYNKDTTIGVDPFKNHVATMQIGDKGRQFIIDLRGVKNLSVPKRIIEDQAIIKIGVNLLYDVKMAMHHFGWKPRNLFDCFIVEQVVRNGIFPGKEDTEGKGDGVGVIRKYTGMKALAKRYLNLDIDKDKELRMGLWKKPVGGFSDRELEYMSGDCIYPHSIAQMQKELIVARGLGAILNMEHALIPVIANMELVGIPFDTAVWISLLQGAQDEKEVAQKKLDALFGIKATAQSNLFGGAEVIRQINYDSSPQMAKALQKKGIKGFSSHSGTSLSTATPIIKLMKIRGQFPADLADAIIEFRKAEQKISSYGTNFLEALHDKTRRIHPEYTQTILVTGRMSASPGVQTIPKDNRYRAAIKAPKGYTFIILDASQIEARITSDLTDDEPAIEVFKRDGDIYTEDGQRFYNTTIVRHTPEGEHLRGLAKAAWLGLSYGQGKVKFHDFTTLNLGQVVSRDDTDYLYDKFFEIHWKMKQEMDEWSKMVDPEHSNRYIKDDIVEQFINKDKTYEAYMRRFSNFKMSHTDADFRAKKIVADLDRVRYAQSLMGRKRYFRADYQGYWTAGRNMPIQSTAADIQKMTLLEFQMMHWDEGYDANVILVVHDELVTLVKEDQAEELFVKQKALGEAVGQRFLVNVPMKMAGGISPVWCKM
jgi:DNA polymerase I-like protein with 3'-5' exonuclease and polymerase domains